MNRRNIINIILIVSVFALALIAWLKPGQSIDVQKKLTALDPSTIHKISIERKGLDTVNFSLIDSKWQLTSPIQAPALPSKVDRLLKISQIKVAALYPLEQAVLETYDLAKPKINVQFNDTSLAIGTNESINSRRYVTDQQSLLLVDDTFTHHLTAPVNQYIDTRLMPDDIQITEIKSPTFHLYKQADNRWQIDNGNSSHAPSPDAVQTLLDEWRFARAIQVTTNPIEPVQPTITLSFSSGTTVIYRYTRSSRGVQLSPVGTSLTYQFSLDKFKKMTELKDKSDA